MRQDVAFSTIWSVLPSGTSGVKIDSVLVEILKEEIRLDVLREV